MGGELFHYEARTNLIGMENPGSLGIATAEALQQAVGAPVTHVLSLVDTTPLTGVTQRVCLVQSACRETILPAVEIAEGWLEQGGCVAVHCQRGVDRTACVLGAILVRAGRAPEPVIDQLLTCIALRIRSPHLRNWWRPSAEVIRGFTSCE